MIDDPYPESWQDLQTGVKRLFRNVGLAADVEVDLQTPRGTVDLFPKNKTMTSMRFPLTYPYWRSQHEEALQRRTNYSRHQRT